MKLYEFEGHNVLSKVGVISPFFVVCTNDSEIEQAQLRIKFPLVAKVQVLSGRRGKSGGVVVCKNEKELRAFSKKFLGRHFAGEIVSNIAIFEKLKIEKELYASITYDTVSKVPFLLFSPQGGADIESISKNKILRFDIDPFVGLTETQLKTKIKDANLIDFLIRLWDAFVRYDTRLVEVNPIGKVKDHYFAIDAKIILDDAGFLRHRELDVVEKGATSALPTERESLAKKIDEEDYRGSAGSTFIELDGDIAVLASGGGASLLVMDALLDNGAQAANYTEYSGNPPREKVEKLTKIALAKKGLSGCLVAGAVANFTDIYETLVGFFDGIVQISPKPKYPIVIRRGGPRQKEAYEYLAKESKKQGYDIHLLGPEIPISIAAKKIVELSREFKVKNK